MITVQHQVNKQGFHQVDVHEKLFSVGPPGVQSTLVMTCYLLQKYCTKIYICCLKLLIAFNVILQLRHLPTEVPMVGTDADLLPKPHMHNAELLSTAREKSGGCIGKEEPLAAIKLCRPRRGFRRISGDSERRWLNLNSCSIGDGRGIKVRWIVFNYVCLLRPTEHTWLHRRQVRVAIGRRRLEGRHLRAPVQVRSLEELGKCQRKKKTQTKSLTRRVPVL